MKMKRWLLCISVFLILAVLFSACAQKTPTTPSATPTPSTTSPSTTSEPRIIKLCSTMSKRGGTGMAFDWFATDFTEKSNGKYKVDYYPGQSLVKSAETLEAIKSGVIDVACQSIADEGKNWQVSALFVLPSAHFPQTKAGLEAATAAHKEMLAKYPVIMNDFKNYKLWAWVVASGYIVCTKDKKVIVPNDLKGLKMGSGVTYHEMLKSVGAIPVSLIPPDTYPALEKGVVDGTITGYEQIYALKFDEVANHFCDYYFAPVIQVVLWNQESWDSFPPDDQNTLADYALKLENMAEEKAMEQISAGIARIKSVPGKEIVEPNAEQTKLWDALIEPMDNDWLNNMKAKGIADAPEMLKLLKQRSAEAWSKNK